MGDTRPSESSEGMDRYQSSQKNRDAKKKREEDDDEEDDVDDPTASERCRRNNAPPRQSHFGQSVDDSQSLTRKSHFGTHNGAPLKKRENAQKRTMFVDGKQLKDKLRSNLRREGYDVLNCYKDEGICQLVARSLLLENITLTLISINAIWIAIDVDWNDSELLWESDPVFIIVENCFCTFFVFEMCMRFGAFRKTKDAFKDPNFLFDFFLVGSMVFETWVTPALIELMGGSGFGSSGGGLMRLLRLLRLTKIARVARLLRSVPEIIILLKGMMRSLRSVCTTLFLMMIIVYAFAIAFRQLSAGTESEQVYFTSVPQAVHTLFLDAVLMAEPSALVGVIKEEEGETGIVLCVTFYIFVLVCTLTILNMLIGVLVDVIKKVADAEHEETIIAKMAEYIEEICRKVLFDGDEDIPTTEFKINKEAFLQLLDDPDTGFAFAEVEVDVVGLVDLVDTIFSEPDGGVDAVTGLATLKERTFDFAGLVEIMLEFRKYKAATVADLTQERKFSRDKMDLIIAELSGMKNQFAAMSKKMDRHRGSTSKDTSRGGGPDPGGGQNSMSKEMWEAWTQETVAAVTKATKDSVSDLPAPIMPMPPRMVCSDQAVQCDLNLNSDEAKDWCQSKEVRAAAQVVGNEFVTLEERKMESIPVANSKLGSNSPLSFAGSFESGRTYPEKARQTPMPMGPGMSKTSTSIGGTVITESAANHRAQATQQSSRLPAAPTTPRTNAIMSWEAKSQLDQPSGDMPQSPGGGPWQNKMKFGGQRGSSEKNAHSENVWMQQMAKHHGGLDGDGNRTPTTPATPDFETVRALEVRALENSPRGRGNGEMWCYRPVEHAANKVMIRTEPRLNGPPAERVLCPGDTFEVSEKFLGPDGVTYLRLADGRGWLFDSKPGVGKMCMPVSSTH